MLGWVSTLVLKLDSSEDFIRVKEDWKASATTFVRSFFSYHYGPYEPRWELESVECKKVTVRVDGINYSGRGFHIHDGSKDNRIYQDQLEAPDLSKADMQGFIKSVLAMRYGKSLEEAFGLKFK